MLIKKAYEDGRKGRVRVKNAREKKSTPPEPPISVCRGLSARTMREKKNPRHKTQKGHIWGRETLDCER